jgi:glycosyltransferase involved in cell wall biosynthesis
VQKEADAVILPYSRDPVHERLYRTHFPSKLPEYLALGMPVLMSGPDYAAGVAWAASHPQAALRLPDDDPEKLRAALEELESDPELRASLARGALAEGERKFAPAKIREQFWQILREEAGNRKA